MNVILGISKIGKFLRGTDHFGHSGTDWRIILKWIFR